MKKEEQKLIQSVRPNAQTRKTITPRESPPNRHPVDELYDVRRELRALEAREAQLRDLLMAGGGGLEGDECRATLTQQTSLRLDKQLAEFYLTPRERALISKEVAFDVLRVFKKGVSKALPRAAVRAIAAKKRRGAS